MRLIRYVVSQSHAIARRERVGFSPRIFSLLNDPRNVTHRPPQTAIGAPDTILDYAARRNLSRSHGPPL